MADEIKEFSRDEVSSTIFYGAPPQAATAQQSAASYTPIVAPVAPPSLVMPSKAKPSAGIPDPTQLVKTVSEANKALKEEAAPPEPPSAIGGLVDQVISNWKPIAATAAATYAVTKAAPIISRGIGSAYSKMKDKSAAGPSELTRIDPIFATEQEMTRAADMAKQPNPLGQTNLTPEALQARAAQVKPAPAAGLPPVPDVPPQFSPGPVSPAGDIPPAPVPTYGPNSSITTKVADTVNDLIDEVDRSKTGQNSGPTVESFARDANGNVMWPEKMSPAGRAGAEAFMKQYPNHAEALAQEGRFGILGAGSGDNNLFNAYGADLRKRLLNELNQGQVVGPYENYSEKIAPAIRALPPETGLGKELADMRINDPKSANRGGLGVSGAVMPDKMVMGTTASKALKAGGKAFLGLAIADAANAANKGDYVGAAKIMGPALDPTGILEAAINPESTARSLSSISPVMGILSQLFGNQAQVKTDKAYAEKVGAGRGLTPASAYKR